MNIETTSRAVGRRRRNSKYKALLDAIDSLKDGEAVLVDVPEAYDATVYRGRLSDAIRYYYEPGTLRFYVTEDDRVAVELR